MVYEERLKNKEGNISRSSSFIVLTQVVSRAKDGKENHYFSYNYLKSFLVISAKRRIKGVPKQNIVKFGQSTKKCDKFSLIGQKPFALIPSLP